MILASIALAGLVVHDEVAEDPYGSAELVVKHLRAAAQKCLAADAVILRKALILDHSAVGKCSA